MLGRFSFFEKSAKPTLLTACVPEGVRVYVVGDIHGRLDLLMALHGDIQEDGKDDADRKVIVYVGDYVDRGDDSKKVIDELLQHPLPEFESFYLKGNHEDALLRFLENPDVARDWFSFGGAATVYSYGVPIPAGIRTDEQLQTIQTAFRIALPEAHLRFLSDLQLCYEIGDYFCVHAGIKPGQALDRQQPEDMMWIRDEFLDSDKLHGKVIVHGHSITDVPDVQENRIGIDTGAYYSNRLTCLVLEGNTRRFLETSID